MNQIQQISGNCIMNNKIQLFLLPYAGGSSFSFMKLVHFLNPQIEAIPIEYAGRGRRKEEQLIKNYDGFLLDVVKQIKEQRNEKIPFSVLGYSMGSALAFDICSQQLIDRNPLHIFFCAEGSLISDSKIRKYALLPYESFKEKIVRLGGLDERVLKDEVILNNYLNLIKSDFDILGQFVYKENAIICDASIIYSTKDSTCNDMEDWKKIIAGNVSFYQVGDNHFFVNQEYKRVANIVNHVLLPEITDVNNRG